MTSEISKDPIVWIDCEMTGLDLEADELVEVAAIVTDSQLQPLDEGIDLVIRPSDAALAQMNAFVRDMHTTSGLLEELPSGTTLADAEERVLAYVRRWVKEPRKAPLAGNSVGTDRTFLSKGMPRLVDHLHYRIIDVSSIKELARRWYPRAYFQAPVKNGGHRALADILDSIDELRYYRSVLLPAGDGPTTDQAKEASAAISADPVAASVARMSAETTGAAGV